MQAASGWKMFSNAFQIWYVTILFENKVSSCRRTENKRDALNNFRFNWIQRNAHYNFTAIKMSCDFFGNFQCILHIPSAIVPFAFVIFWYAKQQ